MNCDQVFDVLTRGPFPTGEASDHAVSEHLGRCSGCRRLADALRPAIELFEEAFLPEETRDLPGYWGPGFGDSEPGGETEQRSVATRRAVSMAAIVPRQVAVDWLRVAAAVALLLTLGGALCGAAWLQMRSTTGTSLAAERSGLIEPDDRYVALVADHVLPALGVEPACHPVGQARAASVSSSRAASSESQHLRLICCTRCHAAGAAAPATSLAISRVADSCQVCHLN